MPLGRGFNEIDGKARKRGVRRTAIVLRAWDQFLWTDDDIRNVRALISEVFLLGNDYSVHILLQIKGYVAPGQDLETAKGRLIPAEFANITEAWTTSDSQNAYPAVGEYQYDTAAKRSSSRVTLTMCDSQILLSCVYGAADVCR